MNIILIGAQASGKMTIGQELEKITGARLIHNHETIDYALRFIPDFTPSMFELNSRITFTIYDVLSKNNQEIIGTALVNFNDEDAVDFLKIIQTIFNTNAKEVCFVNLECELEERLRRNITENRMKHKPLKREIEISEQEILETSQTAQYVSPCKPEGITYYLKLNNTNLSAQEAAQIILQQIKEMANS